jgi:ABC-2 type transport system permease protein
VAFGFREYVAGGIPELVEDSHLVHSSHHLDWGGRCELVMLYSIFGGMFTTVGVVIVMQDAVVGEKVTGTAAWVLSKPISRSSFILAKLVSNAVGFAVTATLVPGIVAYLIITLGTGESLSIPRFLGGMGVLFLFELFWLVFTLMLGTFFQSRGPVIGLPLALILGQQFILGLLMSFSPGLVNFLPYALIMMPDVATEPSITVSVILGIQPETWLPLIASIFLTILFLLVGIWRFRREEF